MERSDIRERRSRISLRSMRATSYVATFLLRARPDAELDAVAVAIAVLAEPGVLEAAAVVRRVERIALADALAVGVPEAAREQARARDDGRAVGEVHRADGLAGEIARGELAAQRQADQLAAEL